MSETNKDAICEACLAEIKELFEKYAREYGLIYDLPYEKAWKFDAISDTEDLMCRYEDETCFVPVGFLSENGYEFSYEFSEVMFDDEDLVEEHASNGAYFDRQEELCEKWAPVFDGILAEVNRICGKWYKEHAA